MRSSGALKVAGALSAIVAAVLIWSAGAHVLVAFGDERTSNENQEALTSHEVSKMQRTSREAHLFSTVGFDRPVSYQVMFEANGGVGEMETWEVSVAPIDTSPRVLPACTFIRKGYEFAGWITVCPPLCKLNAETLEDGQKFAGLSWQARTPNAQQLGWQGPLTLQSFANEEHQIVLKALWRNTKTGVLSGAQKPLRLMSSSTVQTLYLYQSGYFGYLSTDSAPAGYDNKTALAVVPTSSSSPVYILHNPYDPWKYHFTAFEDEYNHLGEIGWTRQGVAFYSDDAQGITIYRFYREVDDAHNYSLSNKLEGYGDEEISCFGVKYYSLAFDGNGATGGSLDAQRLQYGLSYFLPDCPFTWADHTFIGWRGSNGLTYSAKEQVSNLIALSEGTVTMYALWKLSCYRVSFDPNGGQGALPAEGVVTGADYVLRDPGCPFSRVGYVFAGWNTQVDGSGIHIEPQGSALLQGDEVQVRLYAQWQPLQLELSVPATIDLSISAQGRVSSDKTCTIQNRGVVSAQLSHLRVAQNGLFDFVRDNPQRNQIALAFDDGVDHRVNLSDYVGESVFALPSSQRVRVAAGESFAVQVNGMCGQINADDLNGEGATIAQINWGFSIADVALRYVVFPNTEPLLQTGNVGDRVRVAHCAEHRAGYRFVGWSTDEFGLGKHYAPGDTIVCSQDTTLYAQWERVS